MNLPIFSFKYGFKGRVRELKTKGCFLNTESKKTINTADVFSDLNQKYSKSGAILKGARLKEDLSQKKLGQKLNLPQNLISNMERGKKPIDKKMAQRLSKILKIPYKAFL